MIIIGVDFHPEFQQIASVDTTTDEFEERRLQHREAYPSKRPRSFAPRSTMLGIVPGIVGYASSAPFRGGTVSEKGWEFR